MQEPETVYQIVQVLMAMIGALGFSVLFHIRGYRLILTGIGGAVTWTVYLTVYGMNQNKMFAFFMSSLVIGLLTEIMARITKTPVIMLFVPAVIPLIPGSDLYYMMMHLVRGDSAQCQSYAYLLLGEAGGIAFGMFITETFFQLIGKTGEYWNRKKTEA